MNKFFIVIFSCILLGSACEHLSIGHIGLGMTCLFSWFMWNWICDFKVFKWREVINFVFIPRI